MSNKKDNTIYDVAVIGAGLSGIYTARLLKEQGFNVIVLEANDYIGGRLCGQSIQNGKVVIDIGGQWVGPMQTKILKLVKELGLTTYQQYFEQENGWSTMIMPSIGGKSNILRYVGSSIPKDATYITEETLSDFDKGVVLIEEWAKTVPVDKPWNCKRAKEFDEKTVQSAMDEIFKTDVAKDLLKSFVVTIYACEPGEVSFLFFLWYIACAGGSFYDLLNVRNAAQDSKVYLGTQNVVLQLAKKCNLNVKLEHVVSKVEDLGNLVNIECRNGSKFTTKFVVCSTAPWANLQIEFSPQLPSSRHQLCQRYPMGYAIKCFMLFKQPFWRKMGSNGFLFSLVEEDYITLTYDIGYKDDLVYGIVGFVYSYKAIEFAKKSKEEKIDILLKQYSESFGGSLDLWKSQLVDYIEKDWGNQPFARGSYGGITVPGTLIKCKEALREPLLGGKLQFAGTECGTKWIGYMEGAIDSAEICVKSLLPLLQRSSKL
ncbi:hypothetical protein ABK040_010807 [Willaertia magna]